MANSVVLLVDDDKLALSSFRRRLRNVAVITAGNVTEALAALSPCPDIVLTDFLMPGGTGLDLLAEVQRRCPRARRFLMSGATHLVPADAAQVAEEIFDKTSPELSALLDRINAGKLP
jgi:DNA-binding NtrC family response regulator